MITVFVAYYKQKCGRREFVKFFDKWLSIIRETKKGQKYINKVLDYQNDSVAEYVGFESAKQYTDDEIKEFYQI